MRRLNKPQEDMQSFFQLCIGNIRDADFRQRLMDSTTSIVDSYIEYNFNAENNLLHTIPQHQIVNGIVSKSEMEWLYNNKVVHKKSPGRYFYDQAIASPKHGICPLCGQRTVSTIDHHLPKAHFPSLAVTPANLTPCCIDCNKVKDDFVPTQNDEGTIHPYYDNIENDLWLYANVIQSFPVALTFFVQPPDHWSAVLQSRVNKHFNLFQLNKLYSSHAAVELTNINYTLNKLFAAGGKEAVFEYLNENAESRNQSHINSWQAAFYNALKNSDWFCEGGFIIAN